MYLPAALNPIATIALIRPYRQAFFKLFFRFFCFNKTARHTEIRQEQICSKTAAKFANGTKPINQNKPGQTPITNSSIARASIATVNLPQ